MSHDAITCGNLRGCVPTGSKGFDGVLLGEGVARLIRMVGIIDVGN